MPITTPQKSKIPNIGIFLICLLLGCALAYFYAYPQYKQYKTSQSQLAVNQDTISKLQIEKDQATKSVHNMDASESLANLDLAIPDAANIPDLYAYLETMAKASNLSLSTVQALDESQKTSAGGASADMPSGAGIASAAQPASATSTSAKTSSKLPADLNKIDITMTVKGSVSDFNQFLGALEKSLRFMDVQNIDISSGDSNSGTTTGTTASAGQPELTYNLQIVTYYSK